MLKLVPRRNRVPNALAVIGALLLVASTLGGAGQVLHGARQNETARHEAAGVERNAGAAEPADTMREPAVTKTRKFRVNLFLFRH